MALAIAGVLMSSTAAVAAPDRGSKSGRLAGTTVVSFEGNTGIRLTTPRTLLTGEDVDLRMKSGSYAFVRLVQPEEFDCPQEVGPRCKTFQFDWIRGFTTDARSVVPPERQHMSIVTEPATIKGPVMDVYVFSDGVGELTIRTPLRGRTAYRAAGRVVGRAAPLPLQCSIGCGSEDSTTLRHAGLEYDLGRQGWAQVFVISRNRDAGGENGFSGAEACLAPNPASPQASSKPADHPYGCGAPPYESQREYVEGAFGVVGIASTLTPTSSIGAMVWWTAAKGRQYIGGRAVATGVEVRSIQVYAVAFRYGIR